MINEIRGLLTNVYEPKKKALYMELHNRAFPLSKLDPECVYCGSKAYYNLSEYLHNFEKKEMAKTTKNKYELVDPNSIVTLKSFHNIKLDVNTPQEVLEAAFNAGFKEYVKLSGE